MNNQKNWERFFKKFDNLSDEEFCAVLEKLDNTPDIPFYIEDNIDNKENKKKKRTDKYVFSN